MRIIVKAAPGWEGSAKELEKIGECGMPPEAEVIYRGRNVLWEQWLGGKKVVVKAFRKPNALNAIAYTTVRRSKARRSMEHALKLLGMGFHTPLPVAWIEVRKGLVLTGSYYICEKLGEAVDIRGWECFPDGTELTDAFAGEIVRLHRAGVYNKDFSGGNVMVKRGEHSGRYSFWYVDLNRIEFEVYDRRHLMRMFRNINPDRGTAALLARKYGEKSGLAPKETEAEAMEAMDGYEAVQRRKRLVKRIRKGVFLFNIMFSAVLLAAFVSCSGASGANASDKRKEKEAVTDAVCCGDCSACTLEECVAGSGSEGNTEAGYAAVESRIPDFNADSAMLYIKRQVEFGPRVTGSKGHARAAEWLGKELRRRGGEVILQKARLRAFDGTVLNAVNILASFNPGASDRTLLLAHYDTRPWADQDKDISKRGTPIEGANDGASGVAVLLETARAIAAHNPGKGIDILFADAEDYGTDGDDESWAMGTRWFAQHPVKPGYKPSRAILLDMVGGKDAVFPAEYFSRRAAPELDDALRRSAAEAGYAEYFPSTMGGAVTDDHVELIKAGIPAVDIIDYRPATGFNSTWHTSDDNLSNIDPRTLKAVGQTLLNWIYKEN